MSSPLEHIIHLSPSSGFIPPHKAALTGLLSVHPVGKPRRDAALAVRKGECCGRSRASKCQVNRQRWILQLLGTAERAGEGSFLYVLPSTSVGGSLYWICFSVPRQSPSYVQDTAMLHTTYITTNNVITNAQEQNTVRRRSCMTICSQPCFNHISCYC